MADRELLDKLQERLRMFNEQRKVNDRIKDLKRKAKKFVEEQEGLETELINLIIDKENRIKNK